MKFEVEALSGMKGTSIRLGRLVDLGKNHAQSIRTPAYFVYTRSGHIPHLTWNIVKKHLRFGQTPVFQLSLSTVFDMLKQVKANGNSAAPFFKIPGNFLVHLSIWDPLGKRDSGFNLSKSPAIWTKAGRVNVKAKDMKDALDVIKPDFYSTLFDYDTPRDCLNKRLNKSLLRTLDWCNETRKIDEPEECQAFPFVSLGGGSSAYHRQKFAKELCSHSCSKAFNVDLSMFSKNPLFSDGCVQNEDAQRFDESEIKALLSDAMMEIPSGSVRLTEGVFDPKQILFLAQLGIDIFDSSYAIWLAEQGKGFQLSDDFPNDSSCFVVVDFNDSRFQDDFSPLFNGCQCYGCLNYSKAYVQHLSNTKEMLSQILLVVHNLHEFDRMFVRLRQFAGLIQTEVSPSGE